jgi:hypothetical protein
MTRHTGPLGSGSAITIGVGQGIAMVVERVLEVELARS